MELFIFPVERPKIHGWALASFVSQLLDSLNNLDSVKKAVLVGPDLTCDRQIDISHFLERAEFHSECLIVYAIFSETKQHYTLLVRFEWKEGLPAMKGAYPRTPGDDPTPYPTITNYIYQLSDKNEFVLFRADAEAHWPDIKSKPHHLHRGRAPRGQKKFVKVGMFAGTLSALVRMVEEYVD